jgi:predicted PurR-regulated permease PerM
MADPIAAGGPSPEPAAHAENAESMTETTATPPNVPAGDDQNGSRALRVVTELAHPLTWAFVATIGVLLGLSLGSALGALSAIMVTIGISLFLSLALDPAVRRLEARGLARGRSVAIVCSIFALVIGGVLALLLPAAIGQVVNFAQSIPGYLVTLHDSTWFQSFIATTGGAAFYESMLATIQLWLSDPAHLLALGAGAFAAGVSVISAVSATMIIVVLTIYFLASMEGMKSAFYQLVPAYGRPKVTELTERITRSVGGFVAGGVTLSSCNAAFSFVLLAILGVPYSLMLAMLALVVTTLPMVGSVLFWIIGTFVTLLVSPSAALIFAIVYFIYMQVEAYVMAPRIMGKAVSIPGALVLIGAMVGASLLGLLGALVAVPITASILMILRSVYIPRQNAKTSPDGAADRTPAPPATTTPN